MPPGQHVSASQGTQVTLVLVLSANQELGRLRQEKPLVLSAKTTPSIPALALQHHLNVLLAQFTRAAPEVHRQ